MYQAPDIWRFALKQVPMQQDLQLIQQQDQEMPGSLHYSIQRYERNTQWNLNDTGMLQYHYEPSDKAGSYLELAFCIAGNAYCTEKARACDNCRWNASHKCLERKETVDLLRFRFSPTHLSQWVARSRSNDHLTEEIMQFRHRSSFSKILPLCGKTRTVLESLLQHNYTGSLQNIYVNAQVQMLLLYSLDCMVGEKSIDVLNCKFLSNAADRDKIVRAREILIEQIGEPITIKELSKRVAMNECYLKKGFKEMFGSTIFDFYQGQRMEHARYLLYEKGLSVTDVSVLLGYSSISHFSTAFKKHTGLKPCELLR